MFLKKALLASSPEAAFLFWVLLGAPIAAVAAAFAPGGVRCEMALLRVHWSSYLALAAATGVMQLATLFAFSRLQVGYSLALFQLSSVLSVLLGRHFFRKATCAAACWGRSSWPWAPR